MDFDEIIGMDSGYSFWFFYNITAKFRKYN